MNFDLINGNPPYQTAQNANGKRGGGANLWDKFISKSFEHLNERGYLCFVNPSGWRKKEHFLFSSMTEKQIHYLEIHNASDGQKTFGANTRYDWYVIENVKNYKKTIIKDETGKLNEIDLSNVPFIPNAEFDKIYSLVAKNDEEKVNILYNRSLYGTDYATSKGYLSDKKTKEYKYPVIHAVNKDKIRYYYSNRNDLGHFGIPKVIFGDNSALNDIIIDHEGKYAMTQHAMAMKVDSIDEAKNIKAAMLSDNFKKILSHCIWSNFQIDKDIIATFRKDFWKEFI